MSEKTLICPMCERPAYGMTDKFCYKDGSELVEVNLHHSCGRKSDMCDSYCPHCGYKIERDPAGNVIN